jgi:hypothetical protein
MGNFIPPGLAGFFHLSEKASLLKNKLRHLARIHALSLSNTHVHIEQGCQVSKNKKRLNLAVSSFKKGQILKCEKEAK